MALSEVSAAVLIGGRSSRMGEPKAILRLEPHGPSLLEMVVSAVSAIASDVFLVGNASWKLPQSINEMRRVGDGGNGAADGVLAALRAARHDACLVVGCDMPFLDVPLLREMVGLASRRGRGVVACDRSGVHPLHAVYLRHDLARVEAIVAGGERSLTAVTREVGMLAFQIDDPARSTRERWSVFNVNTPDDLRVAREHFAHDLDA